MLRSLNYFASVSSVKRDTKIFLNLESSYGSYLERLSHQNKLALRAVFCRYIYGKSMIKEYLLLDAIADTLCDFNLSSYSILLELQGLSDRGMETLVELVTVQQMTGNLVD